MISELCFAFLIGSPWHNIELQTMRKMSLICVFYGSFRFGKSGSGIAYLSDPSLTSPKQKSPLVGFWNDGVDNSELLQI